MIPPFVSAPPYTTVRVLGTTSTRSSKDSYLLERNKKKHRLLPYNAHSEERYTIHDADALSIESNGKSNVGSIQRRRRREIRSGRHCILLENLLASLAAGLTQETNNCSGNIKNLGDLSLNHPRLTPLQTLLFKEKRCVYLEKQHKRLLRLKALERWNRPCPPGSTARRFVRGPGRRSVGCAPCLQDPSA
jgi:hypothetical protein